MTQLFKTGIILPSWDALCADHRSAAALFGQAQERSAGGGTVFLSLAPMQGAPLLVPTHMPLALVADTRVLSAARVGRLCQKVYRFDGRGMVPETSVCPAPAARATRAAFVVSNGFGLGHVARTRMIADGLRPYAPDQAFMSYSGALTDDPHIPVYHLPSPQYLGLNDRQGRLYTREASLRFLQAHAPTHVFYDGNIIPDGLFAALAAHPDIHLTWVRRGMWPASPAPLLMARQALCDLVVEPADIADAYDTGASWKRRLDYCPPSAFLKTAPLRPDMSALMPRAQARAALGLDEGRRYVLLMPGATQKREDTVALTQAVAALRRIDGVTPVIAHWPMAHEVPPAIDGAIVIERQPITPFYRAFDAIVSAAGYNSFHELTPLDVPCVFVPQEDAGRDNQLARARWAADHGYAALCRRGQLAFLDATVRPILENRNRPPFPPSDIVWHQDWASLAAAAGLSTTSKAACPLKKTLSPRRVARLAKACLKRRRGTSSSPHAFVLALNMDLARFNRQAARLPHDLRPIVITNTIPPTALRRAGFAYLWLNPEDMDTPLSLTRTLLTWSRLWKPRHIIVFKKGLFV